MDLNTAWYLLFGVLVTGYAILDGFDLGVGVLHLFARNETERRINTSAIGPVWDGNEVWLLTAGGALFAAFPGVYATVFSGLYLALMLLLVALIARAVSLEFRSKVDSAAWRGAWDWAFGLGSLLPAVLFGVAVGNILRGLPLDSAGEFVGTFVGLLNPYAMLIGLLSLAMFTMHGATYLVLKTDGDLCDRMRRSAARAWVACVLLYVVATLYTVFEAPFLFESSLSSLLSWVFVLLLFASLVYMPVAVRGPHPFHAFLASSGIIAGFIGVAAMGLYPRLVPSCPGLDNSLTIYNAASTARTHTAMLIIALVGMPIVIAYTVAIYWVFRGKTDLTRETY